MALTLAMLANREYYFYIQTDVDTAKVIVQDNLFNDK